MQILVAAILRGANLNIDIHEMLESTLADEIREQVMRLKMPTSEDMKARKSDEEPEIGDLVQGLEDPHNAAGAELYQSENSVMLNETRVNGQLLESNNVKVVNSGLRGAVENGEVPGVFVNGKKLKATADYEYIEKEVDDIDKIKILADLERTLKNDKS